MTAAAKNAFVPTPRRAATKGSWRKLWQIPLLLAGVIGFGIGIRAVVQSIRPVPFEKQVDGVEGLIAQEKYSDAIKQINVLAPYYTLPAEQAELHKLAGDATYLAQKDLPAPVRENYQSIAEHYEKAVGLGLPPRLK